MGFSVVNRRCGLAPPEYCLTMNSHPNHDPDVSRSIIERQYMKDFSNQDIYEIDWAYADRQRYLRSIPRTWKERRLPRVILLGASRQMNALRQWGATGQHLTRSIVQKLLAPTVTMAAGHRAELDIHNSTPANIGP